MKTIPTNTLIRKCFVFSLSIFSFISAVAQTETFTNGSIIVNMGVTPQTANNALKPYGMIYDLMRNQKVPIKWVINPNKIKDGEDFTYNGKVYKGGPFIIPASFRTAAVNTLMQSWVTSSPGMDLDTVGTTPLTVPVATTLTAVPRWTLDAKNGGIAQAFLTAAGITNLGFSANAYNWKEVAALDCCDDFFVMPHADPTWATHSRLYSWNQQCLGAIWAACHAVSALENAINPANPAEQMNFLSERTGVTAPAPWPNNSLKLWGSHSGGSLPYTHTRFADPVAQYIGSTDAAQQNGSEQIYIPKQSTDPGGATRWRPETNIVAYDGSQVNVPAPDYANGNVAAVIAYGRGLGQNNRGYVMYEAAHNIGGTGPANIAAQRAFWNFSYFQVLPKAPQVSAFTGPSNGQLVQGGSGIALSVTANSPVGNSMTYSWSSSCGGTFSNGSSASTTFTPPSVGSNTPCIITCTISDGCRLTNYSVPIIVTAPPAPPTPQNDAATLAGGCAPGTSVTLNVLTNDTDPQGAPFTFTSLNLGTASPANAGTWSNVGGSVTFVPDANFNGAATITYTVTNSLGGTANATVTVTVGSTDVNGCTTNQVYAPLNTGFLNLTDNWVSQNGTTAAQNETSLDDVENTYTATGEPSDYVNMGTNSANNIILSIPVPALRAKDSINIYWSKGTNNSIGTLSVQIGTSASGPWTNTQTFTITPNGTGASVSTVSVYALPTGASGITHVRISAGIPSPATNSAAQVWLDAVEYEYLSCVSRAPVAQNDDVKLLEDVPTVIRVLDNDSDPAGSVLTVSAIVSPPANGKVSINNDGTVTYVNTTDFSGLDAFTYRVCNAQGYCATATVNLTIVDDGCAPGSFRANPPGGPQTRIFQSGFAGTNAATANGNANNFGDTYLDQSSGGNDNRNGSDLTIGYRNAETKITRTVAWFNISEIPAGAIVQSASYSLLRSGGDGDAQTISLHPLTRSFNETQATWLIAQTGAGNTWTTAGGDFGSSLASTNITSAKVWYNWSSTTFTNQVQSWVTTPANNFGMLLKSAETLNKRHKFYRKEDGTAIRRPTLTITYVIPEPCAVTPNRNPLANPDTATTNSITAVTISPLGNDSDPDALQTISLLTVGAVTGGSAIVSGNNIIFTPTFGFNGIATVIYNIQDNGTGNLQDQSIVYIRVTNAPPTANRDNSSANSGTNQVITVTTNDVDPEGGSLSAPTITLNPKNGAASFAGNVLTYVPNPGFTGQDTLIYQLCEATAGACSPAPFCDTALVVYTVVNQAPVANNDNVSFRACQPLRINLTGNDTDAEGGILTLNIVTPPASGTLVNNNDGTVTFTPAPNSPSPITFTYNLTDNGVPPQTSANATVTLTINTSPNAPPVANNDVADPQFIGEIVYTNVKDNDSDPDNNPLGPPVITVQPLHGTAIVMDNGLIQYTPNPGYYGTDVLTYSICDTIPLNIVTCTMGIGTCVTATVSYTILPPNNTTSAFNDEHSTWQDINVSNNVLTNDADAEADAQTLGGYFDKDAGIYKTTGTFNVYALDGITLAGTLTIAANGNFTFDPLATFSGVVSIPYYINDVIPDGTKPSVADSAFLKITVTPLPVLSNSIIANNDEYTTPLNINVVSSVTAYNDFDPQGNTFTVTGYTFDSDGNGTQDATGTIGAGIQIGGISTTGIPTNNAGALTQNADGTFTFNPQDDFTGSIDVVYTITDALGATTTAVLHIDILTDANGVANDAPFAGDDFKYTNINTSVSGNALTNDSDPNAGNTIAATPQTTTNATGTLVLAANGSYTFTPAAGYIGPATFNYTICDNQAPALCNEATLHFLIGIDNSTDAINDENSTWQDVNVSGTVLANDYDIENHTQAFGTFLAQGVTPGAPIASGATISGVDKTGAAVATAGVLSFDVNGNYTFDPEPSFSGTISVPYRITDNGNQNKSDTAFLTITVDPLPTTGINTVIANNDENVSNGAAVSSSLFFNDVDPQQDAFTVTSFTGGTVGASGTVTGTDLNGNAVANAGTLIINANGTYTYTPATGFVGSINVPYVITDANAAVSRAVLHIDVLANSNGPVNDPPVAIDDYGYTTINQPVTGNFSNNDSDPNGDAVSYNGVTIVPAGPAIPIGGTVASAQGGTIQFYANGTYLYTPPNGYIGPDRVAYTISDVTAVAPQPLSADAMIHLLIGPGINISGKVWVDANGNIIDAGVSEPETNVSGALYVNLVNASNIVLATTPVAADGSYSFLNINPGATYTLQLSRNQGTVALPSPATQLPANWVNTGETRNGTIDGGSLGLFDSRVYGFTNVLNYDYGIEQLPESNDRTQIVTPVAGNIPAGSVNTPVLGSDPEDGVLGNSNTIVITSLPANATMVYNSASVTLNQNISPFDPSLLSFNGITLGSSTVVFQYAFLDAASQQDPTPADFELRWGTPLPVTGLEVKASLQTADKVIVEWKTETELNSNHFIVERSTDNITFIAVGKVAAAGNSAVTRYYQFADDITALQSTKILYYRIRQVDMDGKAVLSNIATVRKNLNVQISAYPNPFTSEVTITVSAQLSGSIEMRITDVTGRILLRQKNILVRGANQFSIKNLANLPGGTYLLEVINNAENTSTIMKLIKQ